MLRKLPLKFPIQPIIDQVNALEPFKRLELNNPTGEFFSDPWATKEEFVNTPIGEVLSKLGNIGQARLLALESGESYTAHCDPDDRIHLAIVTNPYSYLVDISFNNLHHLNADGHVWHMDTGRIHVAANWGPRTRIHLNVRVLLPKYSSERKGLRIKVLEGDYDWKQLAYMPMMGAVNKYVKNGYITGFKGISEKEILININYPDVLNTAFTLIRNAGVTLEVTDV